MDAVITKWFDLEGKVAIVTGGAKGIGQGIVETLTAAGAQVAIADVDVTAAEALADSLRKQGRTAIPVAVHTADEGSVKAMVRSVVDQLKRIDILVNNAGIYPMARLSELSSELWDRVLGVNLRGPYLCTRMAGEYLIKGGAGGRIINISSINTARTYLGMAHYDASKGGLNAFTRACALEYAPHGITVNTIAPGAVKTPGSLTVRSTLAREMGVDSTDPIDAEFAKRIPLGHWAEPADIGRAVLLLTSRAADYITGQLLYVDGGLKLVM